jgi:hypothetical protein
MIYGLEIRWWHVSTRAGISLGTHFLSRMLATKEITTSSNVRP